MAEAVDARTQPESDVAEGDAALFPPKTELRVTSPENEARLAPTSIARVRLSVIVPPKAPIR